MNASSNIFGQGILVDGAFFPIKTQLEHIRHELYLRTPSAQKPNAPLRLHANITGKLTVEPTLDKDLSEQIAQSTLVAAKQKEVHKTKFIDTPPDLAPPTKQKKKQQATSSMFRKPLRPSDQLARPNPAPAPAASTSSAPTPRPRSPTTNPARAAALSSLRQRLIRYLAKGNRKTDETVKAVAPNCDAIHRQEILEILQEVHHLIFMSVLAYHDYRRSLNLPLRRRRMTACVSKMLLTNTSALMNGPVFQTQSDTP